jgi:dienelactone hydrolase
MNSRNCHQDLWANVVVKVAGAVMFAVLGNATAHGQREREMPIWTGIAPGSEQWHQKEVESSGPPFNTRIVRNVTVPTITMFAPTTPNGTAVLIGPGGGFLMEELDKEGSELARWLSSKGVTAFVLKYRLKETPADNEQFLEVFKTLGHPGENQPHTTPQRKVSVSDVEIRSLAIADGQQAVKLIRQHASEWNINPDRIGIIGFSAGGIVSVGVALHHNEASKPNFAASIYGGVRDDSPVPKDAVPMFIVCASDDPRVNPTTSSELYNDWRAVTPLTELHIYMKGGHGFGVSKRGLPVDQWVERYAEWLGQLGFM